MITALLNEALGPGGRAILGFYFANQSIINIIFVIWAGTMTYASLQLTKIRHMTVKLAVETLKNDPHSNDEQIWAAFRPKWQEEVEKLHPRFILNRWNIWIARPTPEKLIEILRLSPDWFGTIRKGEVLRYRFAIPGKNDKLSSFK